MIEILICSAIGFSFMVYVIQDQINLLLSSTRSNRIYPEQEDTLCSSNCNSVISA